MDLTTDCYLPTAAGFSIVCFMPQINLLAVRRTLRRLARLLQYAQGRDWRENPAPLSSLSGIWKGDWPGAIPGKTLIPEKGKIRSGQSRFYRV